jgi:hypothetical protein
MDNRNDGERMVWVMNRRRRSRRRVHELDCEKLLAMWASSNFDLSEADYTKMCAADVPPGYQWCRYCASAVR